MQESAKSVHCNKLQYAELASSGGQAVISAVIAGPSVATGLRNSKTCPLLFAERAEAPGGSESAVAWVAKIVYLPNYILGFKACFPPELADYTRFEGHNSTLRT